MKILAGDDHAVLRAFLLFYLLLAVAFAGALFYESTKSHQYGSGPMTPSDGPNLPRSP